MSKEITKEGNGLIAEFMGERFTEFHGMLCRCNPEGSPWDNDPIEWLHYERDWSQLMPVVEKIESLGYDTGICWVEIKGEKMPEIMFSPVKKSNMAIEIHTRGGSSKIEATWDCCVQFIQWYNTHKK